MKIIILPVVRSLGLMISMGPTFELVHCKVPNLRSAIANTRLACEFLLATNDFKSF